MYGLEIRSLWLLVTLVLLTATACSKEAAEKPAKKNRDHLVEAVVVARSSLGVEWLRTGTLRARREVAMHNQEEGEIIQLPYFEGDLVKKGDVVVRLDDKLLRSQLSRAKATRNQADQDLKRIQNLFKKKLVSDEELNRAETALEVAKADEEVLATRISYTTIASPMNGIVSARLSEPGNIAERYTHLLTISDPTSLITEVTLSELLISQLSLNHPVEVTVDALGDKTFEGKVVRIFPNLDPVTRQGTVEVELKPVPQGASPGQLCRVKLTTLAAERMMIPFGALRRDQKGEYVVTLDAEGKVQHAPVVVGLRIGEQIEILKGLEDGQQIVTKGFLDLAPGKKVKVVSADGKKNHAGDDKPKPADASKQLNKS
ncbi:MAG TPA: efflux RND transporter periplasmic adaptor subunit [Gammaproteobacteria bacterium]